MRASQSPQSLSLSETNHNPKEVALAASSVLSYNGNRVLIKWLGRIIKQLGDLENCHDKCHHWEDSDVSKWCKLSLIGKSPGKIGVANLPVVSPCFVFAPLKNQYNINFINSFSHVSEISCFSPPHPKCSDYLISYPSKSLGSWSPNFRVQMLKDLTSTEQLEVWCSES